jgi:hypothetical protein
MARVPIITVPVEATTFVAQERYQCQADQRKPKTIRGTPAVMNIDTTLKSLRKYVEAILCRVPRHQPGRELEQGAGGALNELTSSP